MTSSPSDLPATTTRRPGAAGPNRSTPSTIVEPVEQGRSRRAFLRASFWSVIGATVAGGAGLLLDYLWPHQARAPGGPVEVGNVANFPAGDDPTLIRGEREFWLVHLDPAETRPGGSSGGSGFLALWRKCPHLGCAVPWEARFEFRDDPGGWFRCPCHQSTYTKAGVLVHGPAPRSMDTMRVTIDDSGRVVVNTSEVTPGGDDNPDRGVEP